MVRFLVKTRIKTLDHYAKWAKGTYIQDSSLPNQELRRILEEEEAEFIQTTPDIPFFDNDLDEEAIVDEYMEQEENEENVDDPTSEGDTSFDLDIDDIIF